MKNERSLVYYSITLLIFCFLVSSCSGKIETTSFTAMNTYMTVKSYGKKAAAANQLVQREVERLETILSTTIEGSDIYKINNSDIDKRVEIPVKAETAYLIERGAEFYKMTSGAFNPALYPVIREWGFTTGDYKVPEAERIQKLLNFTDYLMVVECPQSGRIETTSDNTVISRPASLQLDFGAIGKGYAGDRAIEILREAGVKSALLDFGGNIQVLGIKPDGSDWTVGIKNPWGGDPVAAVKLRDACMITSGGYERFFTGKDGKKYIHIFDSSTGHPVENDLESVTIVCSEGLYGDALSTSLFVMGLDKSVDFWKSRDRDFDFVIITKDKGIVYTAGLEKSISLLFNFDSVRVVE